jgi:plasmid stabilization system protein ParE
MTTRDVLISSDAEADIAQAVSWYASVGLGLEQEFLRAVEASLASIRRHPEAYPVVYKSLRRALLRRFPYALFYAVLDDTIMVMACFHARRDPHDWQSRS